MKLLAIDGNSILNRAFYGIKLLTTKNGEFTNGIYGFLSILLRMLEETQPDAVACAFDMRGPTFRHNMFDGYKAQRKGMPEELASQMDPLKELLTALGYKIVEREGYEADDILGTLAKTCTDTGNQCVIATGDRDSLQLINDRVTVRLATTKAGQPHSTIYGVEEVKEKYGVAPQQLIDVKALMGDASDNIPGVAGIGEKTALTLISLYGDLDYIYDHLPELDIKPGVRSKLEAGKEMAYTSRDLARIYCESPVDTKLEDYIPKPVDHTKAARLLGRLEMFSMMNRWGIEKDAGGGDGAAPQTPPKSAQVLYNPENGEALAFKEKRLDLLADFGGPSAVRAVAAALSDEQILLIEGEERATAFLRKLLSSEAEIRVFSSKPIYKFTYINDINIQNVIFDCELAAYLLNPTSSSYGVSQLAVGYEIEMRAIENELPEEWKPFAQEAAVQRELYDVLEKRVKESGEDKLLYQVEMPLAKVLAQMECEGFSLDTQALKEYGRELDGRLFELQNGIYEYAGTEFNINSPKQLGEVLFGELGLPAKKKTKSGYSTNAEVLEHLKGKHPIVELILEYRKLAKLKSTYVDGLLKEVDADGRVRSTFQQTETRTGRISSTEPNMQNIPIRTKEGSKLRKFFKAREGWKLIDADYSQIELRVLASIADDKNMIAAFKQGEDIHTTTAAQVFGLPELMVTPLMRSQAKAVNFGIVYGIGAFSLSQDIGVSVAEADRYIKGYLDTYSGVKKYMEETIKFARENGYVKTLFGRRRYLPELSASNKNTQAFGERVAMNTPIQGTAADIIKIAMVRVAQRLEKEKMKAKLILQVHDELLVEAPEEEIHMATIILKEEMEHAAQLKVPLEADTNVGGNWLEAK
ncbi:DNA polymerase I [Youxingia wuxianensis]|uniref:DNA polymerase I n=1 Tax=Youxingia wuxianensis TaxID=2763678 RepID=A0A926ER59_9FIRM|nr:DNA polymerase I [Youxingia wuxianensis]MBC8585917.1 DNA polymerase I [Youxingia wuxianensis]